MTKFTKGKPDLDFVTRIQVDAFPQVLSHANGCGVCDRKAKVAAVLNLARPGANGRWGCVAVAMCSKCNAKLKNPSSTEKLLALAERRAMEHLTCQ